MNNLKLIDTKLLNGWNEYGVNEGFGKIYFWECEIYGYNLKFRVRNYTWVDLAGYQRPSQKWYVYEFYLPCSHAPTLQSWHSYRSQKEMSIQEDIPKMLLKIEPKIKSLIFEYLWSSLNTMSFTEEEEYNLYYYNYTTK